MDRTFRLILSPFIALAALGFVLSVAAHIAAITGSPIRFGNAVWALHVGIFIVWLPTVLVAYRLTRGASRKDFWKIAMVGCPKWMRTALYIIFGYAILNFVLFMARLQVTRNPKAIRRLRLFAVSLDDLLWRRLCHTLLRFFIGSSGMDRKCPNGHSVAIIAKFCAESGA